MGVPFFRHGIEEGDIERVVETLRSPFLTTGATTAAFEEQLADFLGCGAAVGLMSCTHALFLALKAWGVGPGDEVLVPAMTFVASAGAVLHTGATPVFVDVDPRTGLIDLELAEQSIGPSTKALMVVHLYGQMVDMHAARAVVDRHGLKLLEDSAHCLEGGRDDIRPGQLGDAACFSFYATKNITSGEGGALVSNDRDLCDRVKRLRLHGMSTDAVHRYTNRYKHWDVDEVGYKANLTDVQSALLIGQLGRVESGLERREVIAREYERRLVELGLGFPEVTPGSRSARHVFTTWAPEGRRDGFLATLQEAGIGVAVHFRAVPTLRVFANRHETTRLSCPQAERIGECTLTVPLYPSMTDAEVDEVVAALRRCVESDAD